MIFDPPFDPKPFATMALIGLVVLGALALFTFVLVQLRLLARAKEAAEVDRAILSKLDELSDLDLGDEPITKEDWPLDSK